MKYYSFKAIFKGFRKEVLFLGTIDEIPEDYKQFSKVDYFKIEKDGDTTTVYEAVAADAITEKGFQVYCEGF